MPYVRRDLINSIRCLSDGGTIFLHDCFPPDKHHVSSHLCGDCYKVIRAVVKDYSDSLKCVVFDTDCGVGMVKILKPIDSLEYDDEYLWEEMNSNRHQVNLVSASEVDIYV
jgi:hypothetical protein